MDRLLFHPPVAARRNREVWRERVLVDTGAMLQALLRRPRGLEALAALQGLQAPTLIIVGLHDRNVGVDACRDLAADIAGAAPGGV